MTQSQHLMMRFSNQIFPPDFFVPFFHYQQLRVAAAAAEAPHLNELYCLHTADTL